MWLSENWKCCIPENWKPVAWICALRPTSVGQIHHGVKALQTQAWKFEWWTLTSLFVSGLTIPGSIKSHCYNKNFLLATFFFSWANCLMSSQGDAFFMPRISGSGIPDKASVTEGSHKGPWVHDSFDSFILLSPSLITRCEKSPTSN